jgi:hypothetical protein
LLRTPAAPPIHLARDDFSYEAELSVHGNDPSVLPQAQGRRSPEISDDASIGAPQSLHFSGRVILHNL